ncbi:MAG: hypothetical protein AB7V62_12810 [Thermoleophilia bacterium]
MPLLRRRSLAAGLAAIGATAIIAGCGGGSDTLSAEEFRSQADAICADANREIEALAEPTSPDGYVAYIRSALPIQQGQLDKLKALEPPEDLQASFDTGVTAIEQQITAIQGAADRIEAGEDAQTVIAEVDPQIDALNEQSDAAAQSLGLTVCGSDQGDEPTTTATTATAPTAPTTPTTPTETTTDTGTTGAGDAAAYLADVQAAAGALQEFGTLLQSTTGLDDLRAKIPEAQASLDTFDEAIGNLDGYTLPVAQLEEQRAGLARTGPAVSDVLRRFLDAASQGDLAAVQALVPEVTSTIGEFQAAATGG